MHTKRACCREEHVEQISISISNTWKAWSMKEMSWRRWMGSHWSTGSQKKSLLFWLVSPLFGQIVCFTFSSLDVSVSFSPLALMSRMYSFFSINLFTISPVLSSKIIWRYSQKTVSSAQHIDWKLFHRCVNEHRNVVGRFGWEAISVWMYGCMWHVL